MSSSQRKAWLALETGEVYEGLSIGADGESTGEVVFTTSMTGYVEVLTDPSFSGQIVVETYPHVGNHGIQPRDFERARPSVAGFVVGDASSERRGGRWSGPDLSGFLRRHGIVGLTGAPTRELTLKLREKGSLRGAIGTRRSSARARVERARRAPAMAGRALARDVGAPRPVVWGARRWEGLRVAVWDFGVKRSLLDTLKEAGASIKLFPSSSTAHDLLETEPAAVVLSSGPGDPAALEREIAVARELLKSGYPLLGVCLGHQLLGLAAGGSSYKLKFGHHGANHPVRELGTGRILITSQNHGFAIRADSLPSGWAATHVSLHDGTLEGFRHKRKAVTALQFHPEGGPGPIEGRALIRDFVESL